MVSTKQFVCLANSVKTGGRCIAGKVVTGKTFGPWLRPISNRPTAEVMTTEYMYGDNTSPQLLDILEVQLGEPKPHAHQTENYLIEAVRWKKAGTASYASLAAMLDNKPTLWGSGASTYGGINDCISPEEAATFDHSLLLIKPANMVIRVGTEGYMYRKRVVRAVFTYGTTQYALKVTDPLADAAFLKMTDDEYPIDAFLCVSLTEPYEKDKRCHKLAAAIISNQPY
jgi:hypothetical protein